MHRAPMPNTSLNVGAVAAASDLRHREHAAAWDYIHQSSNGFANGAHETMLNGIDWPANTALTIRELGAETEIRKALGGDTRFTLYSSWKQVC